MNQLMQMDMGGGRPPAPPGAGAPADLVYDDALANGDALSVQASSGLNYTSGYLEVTGGSSYVRAAPKSGGSPLSVPGSVVAIEVEVYRSAGGFPMKWALAAFVDDLSAGYDFPIDNGGASGLDCYLLGAGFNGATKAGEFAAGAASTDGFSGDNNPANGATADGAWHTYRFQATRAGVIKGWLDGVLLWDIVDASPPAGLGNYILLALNGNAASPMRLRNLKVWNAAQW